MHGAYASSWDMQKPKAKNKWDIDHKGNGWKVRVIWQSVLPCWHLATFWYLILSFGSQNTSRLLMLAPQRCFASSPAIAHRSMILISFVFATVGSSNEFQDVGSYNTCWIYTQTASPETRLQGYGQDHVRCYFYDVAKSSTLFSVGEGCSH